MTGKGSSHERHTNMRSSWFRKPREQPLQPSWLFFRVEELCPKEQLLPDFLQSYMGNDLKKTHHQIELAMPWERLGPQITKELGLFNSQGRYRFGLQFSTCNPYVTDEISHTLGLLRQGSHEYNSATWTLWIFRDKAKILWGQDTGTIT